MHLFIKKKYSIARSSDIQTGRAVTGCSWDEITDQYEQLTICPAMHCTDDKSYGFIWDETNDNYTSIQNGEL